jgi:hypothetical protein
MFSVQFGAEIQREKLNQPGAEILFLKMSPEIRTNGRHL